MKMWRIRHGPQCYVRHIVKYFSSLAGADPGGGRWGARPPLGRSFTIQNTLFNSNRAQFHHWAPTPGRNPVSAPAWTETQSDEVAIFQEYAGKRSPDIALGPITIYMSLFIVSFSNLIYSGTVNLDCDVTFVLTFVFFGFLSYITHKKK